MKRVLFGFLILVIALSLSGCLNRKKPKTSQLKVSSALKRKDRIEQLYNLGWIAGSGGNFELAVNQFKEVLRMNPRHVGATHDLGLALAKLGKMRQSIDYFHKALELNPNYAEAYFNLSTAYYRMEQPDIGAQYLLRCLELDPNHRKALLRKGELAQRRGEIRAATQIYAHYLKSNPTDKRVRAKLGGLYFQQGLDENAKIELLKAVKKIQTPEIFYQLGVIFHRQGQFRNASGYYKKVLLKDPNHVDALISSGEIFERQGNLREALIHFERAYGLEPENEYIRGKIQKFRRSQ
ncbi:tetratricopeptide repeat protein [bacterium]|jgi:tetratricopeptide (TPR) repeat protein|nr:tetratricopeptide repeat protein [bacterium]